MGSGMEFFWFAYEDFVVFLLFVVSGLCLVLATSGGARWVLVGDFSVPVSDEIPLVAP